MLTIWGRPNAYNVQKVLWFIEELGIECKHINIGSSPGDLDSKEFLAINPNGRIPVIKDGEDIVWESNTIIRYLAASYAEKGYWSASLIERTIYERWMDWELSSLQPVFLDLFWAFYRTPQQQRDKAKIEYFRLRCEKYVQLLENHLQNNEYISGDHFGIADICVGTSFYRYFNMGLDVTRSACVKQWYSGLCERPCYQKVIMTPFAELKGRLEF